MAVLVLGLAGCGGRGRGVAVILFDTTRADLLSCYGYPLPTSPHVDGLAAQGLRFLRAYTPAPATLPAVASLLTGRLPRGHGARYNSGYTLSPDVPTLAGILSEAGWASGAFVSAAVLRRGTGLHRGFSVYDDAMTKNAQGRLHFAERPGPETAARALEFLSGVGDRPFFLFVHLYEPHFPYEPPPVQAAQFPHPYGGEIAAADAAIGPLIRKLRSLKPPPLIVFASDHGEGLGDHGEDTHGFFLYESTLRVPLIFWGAGLEAAVAPEPVSLIDVAPSILHLLGMEVPPDMEGRPVAGRRTGHRILSAEAMAPEVEFGWSRSYAAVGPGLKMILSPGPRIFRTGGDPGELDPLPYDALEPAQAELRAELRRLYAGPEASSGPGPEDQERLRSLGYLGGGTGVRDGEFADRGDPPEEERAQAVRETVWLRIQILQGSPSEALNALPKARRLQKKHPASAALRELVAEGEKRAAAAKP